MAEEYRIELSLDAGFTTIEQTIYTTSTEKKITNLSLTTTYYCRISVRTNGDWIIVKRSSCFALIIGFGIKLNDFPHLIQHKDSRMLCISHEEHYRFIPGLGNVELFERPGCVETYIQEEVTGEWDDEHDQSKIHLENCKHCSWYCVRASVAMINNYFGGTLTQDRISFEIYKDWKPEADSDLGHGVGVFHNKTSEILAWSLNNIFEAEIPRKLNNITPLTWDKIKNEIEDNRPVYIDWGNHASVIQGYHEENNTLTGEIRKTVIVADPWPGRPSYYIYEEFSKN